MGIFTKNFSCLSLIGAEKITFPPLCLRQAGGQTDISNYRVALLLTMTISISWKNDLKISEDLEDQNLQDHTWNLKLT